MDPAVVAKWRQLLGKAVERSQALDAGGFWDGSGGPGAAGNGVGSEREIAVLVSGALSSARGGNVEVALWHDLAEGHPPRDPSVHVAREGEGSLVPERHGDGIEVWQRAELAALHALTWHAMKDSRWARRCDSAAAWMLDEVQPDNSTNRPWGLHWFVWMAARGLHAREAELYAESLLHNVMVTGEPPDELDACLLKDSARWLAVADATRVEGARSPSTSSGGCPPPTSRENR